MQQQIKAETLLIKRKLACHLNYELWRSFLLCSIESSNLLLEKVQKGSVKLGTKFENLRNFWLNNKNWVLISYPFWELSVWMNIPKISSQVHGLIKDEIHWLISHGLICYFQYDCKSELGCKESRISLNTSQ